MPYYLWRMADSERYMVLDAKNYPPGEETECFEFLAQAKEEADRLNRTRPDEAQGELGL